MGVVILFHCRIGARLGDQVLTLLTYVTQRIVFDTEAVTYAPFLGLPENFHHQVLAVEDFVSFFDALRQELTAERSDSM